MDPLDGKSEFINGFPDFTVSIALIESCRPVMEVVYLPVTGESYFGDSRGAVKILDGDSTEINISRRANDLRVMTSCSQLDSETLEFLQDFNQATVIQA